MLAPLGFLIAGFFLHAFPWAPLVALLLQVWAMWATSHFYRQWWQRSRIKTVQLITFQLASTVIFHTALMLPGNWLRGMI